MTTQVAPRTSNAVNARPQTNSPVDANGAPNGSEQCIDAVHAAGRQALEPAATFDGVRTGRSAHRPFGPPPSPVLLEEPRGASAEMREKIREENSARIQAYNTAFDGYLHAYADGVHHAHDLEQIRRIGPPVPYAPVDNLPVAQRAAYDDLHQPGLAQHKEVREAIGERIAASLGERPVGVYGFFEGKVAVAGQSAEGRVEVSGHGADAETRVGFGQDASSISRLVGGAPAAGLSGKLDPNSGDVEVFGSLHAAGFEAEIGPHGKHKVAYENPELAVGLEDGKIWLEAGPGMKAHAFGQEAELSARTGSSYDAQTQRAELYAKAKVELGPVVEVEGSGGVGLQLASPRAIQRAITSDDFFAVNAQRVGGR